MEKAIILPVYLKVKNIEELLSSEAIFLTRRAIQSLKILNDQNFTLILPVCLDLQWKDQELLLKMERALKNEIRPLGIKKALLFSTAHLNELRSYLKKRNFKEFSSMIDLQGFSKIRNTGLLLSQALSMEMVTFLDNDEVIEDPDYLQIASEYLNQRFDGKWVTGKGGFYLNPDGSIFLPPRKLWWDILWNKIKWMNQTYQEILKSQERLVPTPMLLGGNLVLHCRLFRRVPFDPFIPRGEDTDYLINASKLGFFILFDLKLRIKHLHPERAGIYYVEELKGDIDRFLYERHKVKRGLSLNLDPYPGYFLKWTLYPKAILTILFLTLDYLLKRDWKKAGESFLIFRRVFQKREDRWLGYLRFREDWEKVMDRIGEEGMDEVIGECWI